MYRGVQVVLIRSVHAKNEFQKSGSRPTQRVITGLQVKKKLKKIRKICFFRRSVRNVDSEDLMNVFHCFHRYFTTMAVYFKYIALDYPFIRFTNMSEECVDYFKV